MKKLIKVARSKAARAERGARIQREKARAIESIVELAQKTMRESYEGSFIADVVCPVVEEPSR